MVGDPGDRKSWRPQSFGRRHVRHLDDPLVEPLWSGIRVLAHVTGGSVEFLDGEGEAQDWPATAGALATAVQADVAVLDGYLTTDASADGVGAVAAPDPDVPTPGQMTRQLFMGAGGGRDRRAEVMAAENATRDRALGEEDEPDVAFVAVDLLMVDGESLLDVPLLERKRLLDGVLLESRLVRRGIHVRLPINVWLITWRSLGFRALAYKDVNSRYRPGMPNEDWATIAIPRN
jgi:ATP-dependent DNA ligase